MTATRRQDPVALTPSPAVPNTQAARTQRRAAYRDHGLPLSADFHPYRAFRATQIQS